MFGKNSAVQHEDHRENSRTHQAVVNTKPSLINYIAAVYAAIGTFLFGYDSGIIASVISAEYDQFQDYFQTGTDDAGNPIVDANITGAIVSVFAGGAFFGALLSGWTADRIGRKRTIQLGCIVATIGCALQTAAVNVGMLIAGRLVAGIAIGELSMIVPMYQISPPHARGLLSGWTQLMISWGFFAANWIGYGCQYLTNTAQFRVPLAIQIVPAVILFGGMFFLPYSPRWLMKQGRADEAKSTIMRLHGGPKKAKPDVVEAEYLEMQLQIDWEREHMSTNFMDLFKTGPNLRRTICGCLVQAMTQWTGVNVNNYYGPTIYRGLGYSGDRVLLIQGISGAFGVIWVFLFITFVVDKIGRRRPMIFGAVALAAIMAWQAGASSPFDDPNYSNTGTGIAGIASIFTFSLVFSMSFGPVSWIYQSEIFPMNLRALGASVSTASNWLNNVIISQVTPYAFDAISWRFFFVFMACNVGNAILTYFLFPETKNKTLEEIGLLFGDQNVRTIAELNVEDATKTEKVAVVAEAETLHAEDAGHKV